jgi:phosphate butyryltransferase
MRSEAAAGPPAGVAVAWATGAETLKAAVLAKAAGLARPVLVGPAAEIREGLGAIGSDTSGIEVRDATDPASAAAICVSMIRTGETALLLKGALSTAQLMRAVLDPDQGLRTGRLLSDVFVFDYGVGDDRRIVGITDGGVVPHPDIDQKEHILRNAVAAFHALGIARPAVALLAAIETVAAAFPSTSEAAALSGKLRGCGETGFEVDGPLAVDLALSREVAEMKGFESSIAGRADILLFPDLESANMSAKSVEYVAGLEPAHCIVGALAPVLIPSRSESAGARLSSIAFGALLSRTRESRV